MSSQQGTIFGGVLLVAGTSIGAGMLALPVLTSPAGFIPTLALFLLCWVIMATSGWFVLNLFLRHPECDNLLTLTEVTLGRSMRNIVWVVYAFLFYSLLVSYITGLGQIIHTLSGHAISSPVSSVLCASILMFVIYLGTQMVDRVNSILMLGLVISYFIFVTLGFAHVDFDYLQRHNWNLFFDGMPIILTSFGFHVIIPTLTLYLKRNVSRLRWVIVLGSLVPLFVYVIWEGLILGMIPFEGDSGLFSALMRQENALISMQMQTGRESIKIIGLYFSCFAIVTSFLGVGLSFLDFLFDGLHLPSTNKNRWVLLLIIFVPPLLLSLWNPHLFFSALQLGGAPSCVFLYLFLPLLMLWKLRVKKTTHLKSIDV